MMMMMKGTRRNRQTTNLLWMCRQDKRERKEGNEKKRTKE
jgi:hypothetical protein